MFLFIFSNKNFSLQVFCDNLFTSLDLLDHMGDRSWGVTGTLRVNRINDIPLPTKKEVEKQFQRGESQAVYSQDLMVSAWKDNQPVYMASNCHDLEPMQECQRFSQKDRKYVKVPQPMTVRKYNTSMGGVDLLDNSAKNYSISIRIRKWYWNMYSWFLNVAMVQAWRLFRITWCQRLEALQEKQRTHNLEWEEKMKERYDQGFAAAAISRVRKEREKQQHKERMELKKRAEMSQLEFIRQVVEVSLKTNAASRPENQPIQAKLVAASLDIIRLDQGSHLVKMTEIAGVCRLCKGRTKFRCMRCNVALHAERCFFKFHGGEEESE